MQHERLFAFTGQAVDDLRVTPRAQRRDHQGLCLAAGEERGTVRPGQHAGADLYGSHRFRVTTVDAGMSVENTLAHEPVFQIEELGPDLIRGELRRLAFGERFDRRGLDLPDLRVALLLFRDGIRGDEILLRDRAHRILEFGVRRRPNPRPFRFAGFGRKFVDGFNRRLHLFVAERDGTQHDFFVQAIRLGFDHQYAFGGAGDDEIEFRLAELRRRGIEYVLAADVTHTRRTDGTHEGHARNRQRRGRAEQ